MPLTTSTFFTRRELFSRGVTDPDIKRAVRTGAIVPLGKGAYAEAKAYANSNSEQRHIFAVRACAAVTKNPVVSHHSAAAVHGLSTWKADLSRVHLSVNASRGGRITQNVHVHTNRFADGDVVTVDGLPVTSIARTVVDLSRESFEAGVCVADSALFTGAITMEELTSALAAAGGLTGCSVARRVVEFADGRSESVGESRSRVYVERHGFPAPKLQVTVRDPTTGLVARPDFMYEEEGVLLEFDGRVKYKSEQDAFDEKVREDALRSLGWVVVRWIWDDLATDRAAHLLERGFVLAASMPEPIRF